jgi:hypothetical protein
MRYIHARARPLLAAALLVTSAPALHAQDPSPPPATLRGDVDGDGRVTAADAAAVRAYLVRGTLPGGRAILSAGDANGDGRVTAADAALISRFAAGVDVSRFGLGRPVPGSESGGRTFVGAEYECIVDIGEGTTDCAPVGPTSRDDGPRLDVLPGVGPLTFVGNWTHSRGSTTDEDTSVNALRFVSNIAQPIGTTDGINPASPGNRLFFTTPPYVVSVYSGTVAGASIALVTPDGTDTFTNPDGTATYAARPFYEYAGILEQGDTSVSRTIRYIYSSNLQSFGYRYRVSAPVQYEHGWITLSPSTLPTLNPGSPAVTFTGTEYDAYGAVQANGITWSSSNPSVATVNASTGEVTLVAVGTTTITATSNANAQRTGSREITVTNVNTWEGDVSSDWHTAGNWDAGVVPDSATVAVIPATGTLPNLPELTANAQVLDLTVGSARTLGLGGFTLQADGDVTATGTVSNGVLQLSGSDADWQGTVDDVVISGAGFLAGATTATGPVSVTGSLTIADQALSIAIP